MMFKPLTFPRYHGAWTTTIRCNKEIPKICYILESWPNYWNIMDFEQCLFSIGYHICVSKILVISPYSKSLHIERTMHTFCTMWRTSTTATPKNRPKENIAWWRRKWLFKLLRSMSFFGFSKKNMIPFSSPSSELHEDERSSKFSNIKHTGRVNFWSVFGQLLFCRKMERFSS